MELVAGTLKRRLSLDAVLASFSSAPLARVAPEVLEALRLGAFQLLFLDRVPAHAAVGDGVALVAAHGRKYAGLRERRPACGGPRRPRSARGEPRAATTTSTAAVPLVVPGVDRVAAPRGPGPRGGGGLLAAADTTPPSAACV